jgi:phage tail-like protein
MPEAKPPDAPAAKGGESGASPSGGPSMLRGYLFRLIIDPANDAHFISCSGPRVRVVPIRQRGGGEVGVTHVLAGPVEHAEVICEAGMTTSSMLWDWFQKSQDGTPEPRNVSLVMLGPDGGERVRWNLNGAWPCEWSASPMHALGREIAIETLALCYEELTRGGKP